MFRKYLALKVFSLCLGFFLINSNAIASPVLFGRYTISSHQLTMTIPAGTRQIVNHPQNPNYVMFKLGNDLMGVAGNLYEVETIQKANIIKEGTF